jgi:hypothetical protein
LEPVKGSVPWCDPPPPWNCDWVWRWLLGGVKTCLPEVSVSVQLCPPLEFELELAPELLAEELPGPHEALALALALAVALPPVAEFELELLFEFELLFELLITFESVI